jgi:hypothetical protein
MVVLVQILFLQANGAPLRDCHIPCLGVPRPFHKHFRFLTLTAVHAVFALRDSAEYTSGRRAVVI